MSLALEVRDLSFHFSNGPGALDKVSFSVAVGECVAVIGPNGAGKSTLLLHLNGLLPDGGRGHSEGVVRVLGTEVAPESLAKVRREVGLLFQDPDDQLFCATIGEDVAFGPEQLGLRGEALQQRVRKALEVVGLTGLERRSPQRLSGGEKKRACIAGLLACESRILALDEPTTGLDPAGRRELIELLKDLPATKIIATHDLALVSELSARVVVLDKGRVVKEGETRSVLLDDDLMRAHGLGCPREELPAKLLGL